MAEEWRPLPLSTVLRDNDVFIFSLALALGKTEDELIHTMTARELARWRRFDNKTGKISGSPNFTL